MLASVKTVKTRILAMMALCCGAALSGGCTSLVTITSEPSGARVRIDGTNRGRTPLAAPVEWSADEHNEITLEHPDCHRLSTVLRRTPQVGYILADILTFYGLVALPYNSMGPVKKQHFVLAPRPTEQGGGGPERDGGSGKDRPISLAKGGG